MRAATFIGALLVVAAFAAPPVASRRLLVDPQPRVAEVYDCQVPDAGAEPDESVTIVALRSDGSVAEKACPGSTVVLEVSLPSPRVGIITSSIGTFVVPSPEENCPRQVTLGEPDAPEAQYRVALALPSDATGPLTLTLLSTEPDSETWLSYSITLAVEPREEHEAEEAAEDAVEKAQEDDDEELGEAEQNEQLDEQDEEEDPEEDDEEEDNEEDEDLDEDEGDEDEDLDEDEEGDEDGEGDEEDDTPAPPPEELEEVEVGESQAVPAPEE
ncbi:hypothetical protein HYH03_006372 [Edaphochlamys debaryana]|uniref:Uncharacterized protein n=1 Tax=Edaphochlamys debaryana TaxID=47281 RepID=A0A835YAP0_9CHLO|nr:hypothetical protein HYH03_006372 [Edaphochlamys debaryana]|eukprot:KAG2495425.1 hypothetical protein HYH03_006372 [Edaphochlamys debaryana]